MTDIETRIAGLPLWRGNPQIAPLVGGLSNLSFTVTDASGKYVVRITRDFPFHHVYREREVMSARAAHAAGFAPEIVHAEPGLMVSRWIEGKVFGPADIRANIPRMADLLRRFHNDMQTRVSGAGFIFWAFHVNRDYLLTLERDGHDNAAARSKWSAINTELEAAQLPLPIVFGHHDLLPANLIDDGKRLWLIDYEYAGFGTAMFDLANLSSNSGFSPEDAMRLLGAYFGDVSEQILRSHGAMECASLLREALWSLVSAIHLKAPGADYAAYAEENFARLDAALAAWRGRFA